MVEPDEEVHVEGDGGLIVSPGNEESSYPKTSRQDVASLRTWLDAQLHDESSQLRLAEWHTWHGRVDASLEILKRLEGRTSDAIHFRTLAYTLTATGEFEKASEALRRVVETDPQNYDVRLELVSALLPRTGPL